MSLLKRKLTNKINHFFDFYLPSGIRNNRFFLYPIFFVLLKGRMVREFMDFKKNVYDFTDLEIEIFYSKISSIISNRETDLNPKCIDKILLTIDKKGDNKKILDVGCGEGYILNRLSKFCNSDNLYGSDFIEATNNSHYKFSKAEITDLPYEDKYFDIVICTHTLEHVVNLEKAINELIRVCKDTLIVVMPKQKYNMYTFDLHINFFNNRSEVSRLFDIDEYELDIIDGDWFYVGKNK